MFFPVRLCGYTHRLSALPAHLFGLCDRRTVPDAVAQDDCFDVILLPGGRILGSTPEHSVGTTAFTIATSSAASSSSGIDPAMPNQFVIFPALLRLLFFVFMAQILLWVWFKSEFGEKSCQNR